MPMSTAMGMSALPYIIINSKHVLMKLNCCCCFSGNGGDDAVVVRISNLANLYNVLLLFCVLVLHTHTH